MGRAQGMIHQWLAAVRDSKLGGQAGKLALQLCTHLHYSAGGEPISP